MLGSRFSQLGGIIVIGLLFLFFSALRGCATIGSPDGYHYRATVYVDDGGRERRFSAVREVHFESDFAFGSGLRRSHQSRVSGEAIPIESGGRTYYALQDDLYDWPAFHALAPSARQADGSDVRAAIMKLSGEYNLPRKLTRGDISDTRYRREDPEKTWPMFVTFSDPEDPETMRIVDPNQIGVTRITIQVTSDDIAPQVGGMFSAHFWQRWDELRRRSLPERGQDPNGRAAPYYSVSPGQMRISET